MKEQCATFEQPLNEHTRACLRLEHLFTQAKANLDSDTVWGSRSALVAIIEALNVIDRPDLKTKLANALSQQAEKLAQLEASPQVDSEKLRKVLHELDRFIDCLHGTKGKISQSLRANDFLNTIRQHLQNPGGACGFNTPAYHLWLQQPTSVRSNDLHAWYQEFEPLHGIISLLLQITRHNASLQTHQAEQGFFQLTLDPNIQFELIRVMLPADKKIFPEISVGRHRLVVRFLNHDITCRERPPQSRENIAFKLACCS